MVMNKYRQQRSILVLIIQYDACRQKARVFNSR
jgi:hypothetical protein